MRKFGLIMVFCWLSFAYAQAQTLNIHQGNVTYAIPASQTGEMVFNGESSLTIGQKTYNISEITSITTNESVVTDNTVNVTYDGSSAQVVIAGNVAPYITASVRGAHVTILADIALSEEVTYTLSGSSTNGSLYMDGDYKSTFMLNNLQLTNPDSCAINIQNGKLIGMVLADGTLNTLTDGLTNVTDDGTDAHKAALYINGHASWTGGGALTLNGNVKHAYFSDEYTVLNAGLGTITVASAVGDGFHVNEYFQMQGGTVNINAQGDGVDVGVRNKSTDENNGNMLLEGGTLTVKITGVATKALKCEKTMMVSDGTITATTTGTATYDAAAVDFSSCAGVKCGVFTMTGGTMNLTSTGAGGKGLNSDGDVNINGGTLTVVTTGATFTHGSDDTKPQGIKSDTAIRLNGGTVLVAASSDNGSPLKTDDVAVYCNGSTLMGIGGKKVTPSSASTCGYKNYSSQNVTGGTTVTLDGISFSIPAIYSNASAKIIVSSPNM